jgi:hypothetical protein
MSKKKQRQNKSEKEGGKTKGDKKLNRKRRKYNKTLIKNEKGWEKTLQKAVKGRNQRSKFWHMNC